jgi:hypothetical protein
MQEGTVRPRNVDGVITCPPGYELRPDGACHPVGVVDESPATPAMNEVVAPAPVVESVEPPPTPLLPMSTESTGAGSVPAVDDSADEDADEGE